VNACYECVAEFGPPDTWRVVSWTSIGLGQASDFGFEYRIARRTGSPKPEA
jgi:hypothetical protein